jgi:hypothetical protein
MTNRKNTNSNYKDKQNRIVHPIMSIMYATSGLTGISYSAERDSKNSEAAGTAASPDDLIGRSLSLEENAPRRIFKECS